MTVHEVIIELKALATQDHFSKLAYFGIKDTNAVGVKVPLIRQLAKKIGENHELALELWKTEIHEARLLATMIDDFKLITESQVDSWVADFNSWDICDQSCNLFVRTTFCRQKIVEYSTSSDEFVKRTAFVLICEVALHDKKAEDSEFYPFLDLIIREAWDERNFVRKAVNWALRQIGKRNESLRLKAIETAENLLVQNSKSARWIASDALRELKNDKTIAMVNRRKK